MWQDATDLEMNTIMPAFDLVDRSALPPGYSNSSCGTLYNTKTDFTSEVRFVMDVHLNQDPVNSNFTGSASRVSVCIFFTYNALNRLDICVSDTKAAYLACMHVRIYLKIFN